MERRDAETQRGSVEAQLPVFRLARARSFRSFFVSGLPGSPGMGRSCWAVAAANSEVFISQYGFCFLGRAIGITINHKLRFMQ